jgi:hypothetical protein
LKGTVDLPAKEVLRIHLLDGDGKVQAIVHHRPIGSDRTAFDIALEAAVYAPDTAKLRVIRRDGRWFTLDNLSLHGLYPDAYHDLTARFFEYLRTKGADSGGTVLEIGSRSRSGYVRRELIQPMNYCGVDIVDGGNVDVICDAHDLRSKFGPGTFDAAFSISTFEHLAMPWKVALEMNYVLKVGAQALIASHQTFPIHEAPWDFWRFSTAAWPALFNEATGFRIIESAYGEPSEITARFPHPPTMALEWQPSFIGSIALVEKTGDTPLRWDVPTAIAAPGTYPM